ncbi:MAG: class F sortase [Candidatus Gracilibacteria bacterium]|nr:class F sortase [Candidatus Gracilibacteria bacterium]
MKTGILLKILVFTLGISGLSYYQIFAPENIITETQAKPIRHFNIVKNKAPGILIARLKIPKIGINTILENVGLTPKGALGVPKGIVNAGLYSLGPAPGENGNAIIDGHFGWINKKPAVFNDLHKLIRGDKIYVHDKKGSIVTFIVSGSRIYKSDDKASEIFISSDGKSHLNLITCQGTWDKKRKEYSDRLVIFADNEI